MGAQDHSWIYLPVLVSAFALMVPFIIIAEKTPDEIRGRRRGARYRVEPWLDADGLGFMALDRCDAAVFWGFNLMENAILAKQGRT